MPVSVLNRNFRWKFAMPGGRAADDSRCKVDFAFLGARGVVEVLVVRRTGFPVPVCELNIAVIVSLPPLDPMARDCEL